ncbi:carboxypeptidase-like regulatory domain-containing protein [Dyadobacter aurulentus]|uniref:carboxypeptidase-like regulatory domain-containing protein n=1 Tax=Dyadobacter sp. UC 10 TaxID=2605428 RepID=UPI0011F252C2|nr:carboxypeptidase-like regulatory domain-containing protein [Dyadobacter sp. UC 10]KAA0991547.1 carboxypeptidase-like regulatory domain-containing protein [Dyadobacter sp. UC 10]
MVVSKIYSPRPITRIRITQLLFLLVALAFISAAPAEDILDKRISIRVNNQPLDETLQQIGELGNFSFSYSPDMIDIKARVSINASDERVRDILNALFKNKVTFKERRKYIILQKKEEPEKTEEPEEFNLNGYIIDNRTGNKLANASIYESATLASAVSNQYGYYKIRLPASTGTIRLEVRKEEYVGKSISITSKQDTYLQINLNPDTLRPISPISQTFTSVPEDSLYHRIEIPKTQVAYSKEAISDTLPIRDSDNHVIGREYERFVKTYQKVQNSFVSAFASAKQAVHTRNITDTLYRPFQASVLPFLGTNHGLSGNIINDYSINFLAGYSLGVDKFEIGTFVNVVRGNVKGFQLAGISNIVGKNVSGFQYSNFLNLTLGNFEGFQGNNVINYTGGNFSGFQLAGVGNVVVGTLKGYQFSLGYNYANTVRSGHQIGTVNYADSSATVPFGLFSYVRRNGYRRYEFGTDEFSYFNTAFKTGMSRFYNIFTLSFNGMAPNKPLGSLGYGFGTAQPLGKGWAANADLTASVVFFKDQKIEEINAGLFRFSISIEKKLGNKFALFAGPSVSLLLSTDQDILKITDRKGLQPIWLGADPGSGQQVYHWLGFQAGIRFCN